jgi:hypothetical protein
MTTKLDPEKATLFRRIFEQPTIDKIFALEPGDVEQFVRYVFEAAGFLVQDVHSNHFPQGPGVDLTLHDAHSPDTLQHLVEVKRWQADVGPEPVQAFGWKLHHKKIPGYFVSVSGFTAAAQAVALQDPDIRLIDGKHLLRYIAYLGRSRVDHAYATIQIPLAEAAGPEWTLKADGVMQAGAPRTQRAAIIAVANNKGGVGTYGIRFGLHVGQNAVPRAIASPAIEPLRTGLPRSVAYWQIAPGRARAQLPQDPIDHRAMIPPLDSPPPAPRQQRLDA